MLETTQLLAFILIYTIDSITPGPAVAAVVARSATSSAWKTLPFILGLVLGDLVLFALAVLGLAALVAALGPLFFIVKWLGIAYLLFLAYGLWTRKPDFSARASPSGKGFRLFALGATMPLGNPKAVGFYVALLPVILDPATLGWVACFELAMVITVVWTGTLYAYALFGDWAGQRLHDPAARRLLNRLAAVTLIGAAGSIAAKS